MESIPEYHIIRELGSGCFGYVFEAEDAKTKQKVAIKRIEKVGKQLSREYEILNEVKGSSHCVHLIDCFYTKSKNDKLIQNLIFEFLNSSLEDIIRRAQKKRKNVKINSFYILDSSSQNYKFSKITQSYR
jgi:glycogen synthase kinase 3 beta